MVHENIKAEFINGEVVMHSPVKREHWRTSARLSKSLIVHANDNHLGEVGIEKVMVHLTRNDYEPDICFFGKEKWRNYTRNNYYFSSGFYCRNTIAHNRKNDRTIKLQDYAAHGVAEYWIIDPVLQSAEQYLLNTEGNYYFQVKLVKEGTIHAVAVEGYQVKLEHIF